MTNKHNLVPRLFLRGRKDPGRSWSRGSQILGAKLKLYLGRGGRRLRLLRLENYNFCVIVPGIKFKFATEILKDFVFTMTRLPTLVKREVGSDFSGHQGFNGNERTLFAVNIF